MKDKSPEKQLAGFIAKYTPEIGALGHAALAKMRARLPGAIELVYALERAAKPLDGTTTGRIVIKSISAKQRPRRPA